MNMHCTVQKLEKKLGNNKSRNSNNTTNFKIASSSSVAADIKLATAAKITQSSDAGFSLSVDSIKLKRSFATLLVTAVS